MTRVLSVLAVVLCIAVVAVPVAQADLYGFHRITDNSPTDIAGQLSVDVTEAGPGLINFRFFNSAVVNSSITDIYFDADALLSINSLAGSGGVSFSQGADPPDLPGGELVDPEFETTLGLSADSDPPGLHNGINHSSEYLDILIDLQTGVAFSDVLVGLDGGSVRIGLHVQGIGPESEGESDSFINNPYPVPAPGALVLGMVGLSIASRVGRRMG